MAPSLSVGQLTGTIVSASIGLVIVGYLATPIVNDLVAEGSGTPGTDGYVEPGPLNKYKGLLNAVIIIMVVMVVAGIAYSLYRN